MEALLLEKRSSTAGFQNFHEHRLTGNTRLFTSLDSAWFKLNGSSFLIAFENIFSQF